MGRVHQLYNACGAGSVAVCDWLVAHGVVVDPTDPEPMCRAAMGGSVGVIEWLCSKGYEATVNVPDSSWCVQTPLHHACGALHVEAAVCLLEHGAAQSTTLHNSQGQTPVSGVMQLRLRVA